MTANVAIFERLGKTKTTEVTCSSTLGVDQRKGRVGKKTTGTVMACAPLTIRHV